MTPAELVAAVRGCLDDAVAAGEVPVPTGEQPVDVVRRRGPGPGTWTTPVAARVAGRGGRAEHLATVLARRLREHPALAEVHELAGGHLGLTPSPASATATALVVRPRGGGGGRPAEVASGDLAALRTAVLGSCRDALRRAHPQERAAGPVGRTGAVRLVPHQRTAPDAAAVVRLLGTDAVQHALLREPQHAAVVLDLAAHRRQDGRNPVFAVRHAHARAARAARAGAAAGVVASAAAPLDGPGEAPLLAAVADHGRVVRRAAATGEPHRLVRHLDDVAALAHDWLDVQAGPGERTAAEDASRLGLAVALRAVLADGLGFLGVTAPERV